MEKQQRPVPFRWQRRTLADQRVFTAHGGDTPVDIETGFLGRYVSYQYLADFMARHGGDITIAERPGFGGLKGLPGKCEIDAHVELKRERLDARREELGDRSARFVLVGHSMGGAITVAFAAKYPSYVKSILDINGIGDPHPDWSIADWDWKGLRSLLPVDARVAKLSPYAKVAARGYVEALASIARHPTPAIKHAMFCMELDNSRAERMVGRHRIPVTMVRGASDLWVPEESMQARANRMRVPTADRHTLPNENHLLGNTLPRALRSIVEAHLGRATPVRSAEYGIGLSLSS